tara:strand:+ start:6252 stop:7502 length:1251 start_codon:yes stop_codon:yes gene_type:complete
MNRNILVKFSSLAIPLSFIGLPIYINISDFYATKFNLSLAFLAISLFIIRIIDIFSDIVIGYISNILVSKNISRSYIINISIIFLILFFYALFNPPNFEDNNYYALWLVITLTFTYIFFNIAVVNYETIAALLAKNDYERISVNSSKELFAIIGFLIAATSPYIFSNNSSKDIQNYQLMTIIFAIIAIVSLLIFSRIKYKEYKNYSSKKINVLQSLKDRKFSKFLLIYIINALAISLPSANIIFYARDILNKEKQIGLYLFIYFIAAGFSIYIWRYLINKYSLYKMWIIAIIFSILTFIFAFFLNEDNSQLFILICIFTGFFLGPDLVAPPSIIAKLSNKSKYAASSYFSLYNMSTKLAIALAATISLIILSFFDYEPDSQINNAKFIIPYLYALIPCSIRLFSIYLIIKYQKLWI